MKLGLIGKNIAYSFSVNYFQKKFFKENIPHFSYENIDIPNIEFVTNYLTDKDFVGFNVTIPYKEKIFQYINEIDENAKEIGAINTLQRTPNGWKGFNTDWLGFDQSISENDWKTFENALIFGSGGAAKAITYALRNRNISYQIVSRSINNLPHYIIYSQLNTEILNKTDLVINCTPIGTFPNVNDCLPIDFKYFRNETYFYDLIYNPAETIFLKQAKLISSRYQNGLQMLINQAELAWKIWCDAD